METLPNNLISQRVCWIVNNDPVQYKYGIIRLIYKEGTEIMCIVQCIDSNTYIKRCLTTLKNN